MGFGLLAYVSTRSVSFFTGRAATDLWKSVTSVSSMGRQRGRQKGRRPIKNLNRGQIMGVGHVNTRFPGMSSPLLSSVGVTEKRGERPKTILNEPKIFPHDPTIEQQRLKIIDESVNKKLRREKLAPLERGYAGSKMPGRRTGAPYAKDATGTMVPIPGLESVCLEVRRVTHMTGKGRADSQRALVAVGNGKGAVGLFLSKKPDARSAIASAIDGAAKRLVSVKMYQNRTIYQDFFAESTRSRVWARRMPVGYGLVCHRVLKSLCEMIGIKDLHVKVEGGQSAQRNVLAIVQAFMTGLNNQETFQELAERKQLMVIEFDPANNFFPTIIASPLNSELRTDVLDDEVLDVDEIYGQGRTPLYYERPAPFWTKLKEYEERKWMKHPYRGQEQAMLRLMRDTTINRWTRRERYQLARRMHAEAMAGTRVIPTGIGLTGVWRLPGDDMDMDEPLKDAD